MMAHPWIQEGKQSSSVFHTAMEELKKESQAALERSAQKSQHIQALQQEKSQLEEALTLRYGFCIGRARRQEGPHDGSPVSSALQREQLR